MHLWTVLSSSSFNVKKPLHRSQQHWHTLQAFYTSLHALSSHGQLSPDAQSLSYSRSQSMTLMYGNSPQIPILSPHSINALPHHTCSQADKHMSEKRYTKDQACAVMGLASNLLQGARLHHECLESVFSHQIWNQSSPVKLCTNISPSLESIDWEIVQAMHQGVTTVKLNTSSLSSDSSPIFSFIVVLNLAAETDANLTAKHPNYAILAAPGSITISNHKETKKLFPTVIKDNMINLKNGKAASMISKETYETAIANKEVLDSAIIYT
ncbi:hypothetical protein D9758_016996 [Tetrapyrgos nigripes]|uniref:Uncharacterized protein n=1 Tax=Tetrapyrgos nigripes TaxID=182062 RepID=A0A8H5C9C3_9AGAR|nr:hypothetical protein D9758_016996 [Tetrapyrgos nigripes]